MKLWWTSVHSYFSRLLTKWRVRWWSWRWTSCPRTGRTCWRRSSWWTNSAIQTYSGESNPVHFCAERNSTDEQIIYLLYTCRIFSVVSRRRNRKKWRNYSCILVNDYIWIDIYWYIDIFELGCVSIWNFKGYCFCLN